MIEVRQSEVFADWFSKLRDIRAKAQILRRIERLEAGNPGDVAPIREGVSEMRINFGPGYRVYFSRHGDILVLLLCGGDKSTQSRDVVRALELAKEFNR